MSNWQQPSFNLDAPEFVPKFGSGPSPPNQNRNMPPQHQQGNYPQQHQVPFNQFSPQHQQQQPYYNNNNNHQQMYRQPYPYNEHHYQQQQQQMHFNNQPQQHYFQQQFNNVNPAAAQGPPPQQPIQSNNTSDSKQINQLTNNLSKLSTNAPAPAPTVAAPAQVKTTSESKANESNEVKSPKEEVKKHHNDTNESKPSEQHHSSHHGLHYEKPDIPMPDEEPSALIEKSIPPSEATIKEDEEWEESGAGAAGATGGAEEGAKVAKKAIVIREYKPKKETINVIFCGHVDAGKSTIGGQIMFLTGMVDKRTLEKYEREAKEKNRESWYLSWALDTNQEEREKGKTVEVGRAFFETEKKHFIILDAPGHRGFVPNMIGGASQADIAVLVISARRGEFETGFERGGQTREHAMLVKTAGVKYLIVLVNKMDDSTVNWDEARYIEIKEKLTPYLKKCGFVPNKDTFFMPCSGFTGAFIKEPISESICPWYREPCFIELIENLPTINRTINGPVRMPLIDKYKDMGTVVMGKLESGMVRLNDKLCVMPNKIKVEVANIYCEEDETDSAICGENVKLKLKGIEEEEISSGSVLCDLKDTCQVARVFDAQVVILECPSIICAGFNSILHIHAATAEVQLKTIIGMVDKKSGEKDLKNRPRFIKQDQIAICRFEVLNNTVICMEPFKLFPQLGRFTLRYENKTVAVGKVLKVIE